MLISLHLKYNNSTFNNIDSTDLNIKLDLESILSDIICDGIDKDDLTKYIEFGDIPSAIKYYWRLHLREGCQEDKLIDLINNSLIEKEQLELLTEIYNGCSVYKTKEIRLKNIVFEKKILIEEEIIRKI